MAKFTRRSYRRRKVLVGAALFAAVASISTGFASFIISLSAEKIMGGNVNVGTVTNSSIEITVDGLDEDGNLLQEFNFEALEGDNTGRVQAGSEGPFENLSITVTGKVSNTGFVKDDQVNIKLDLPESIRNGATQGYIVLPDCAKLTDPEKDGTFTTLEGVNVKLESDGTFSYTIEFKWGSYFNGLNPCSYYDNDPTGQAVKDSDLEGLMNTFRDVMTKDAPAEGMTFNLTITAQVK